jgi:hypothetical protein
MSCCRIAGGLADPPGLAHSATRRTAEPSIVPTSSPGVNVASPDAHRRGNRGWGGCAGGCSAAGSCRRWTRRSKPARWRATRPSREPRQQRLGLQPAPASRTRWTIERARRPEATAQPSLQPPQPTSPLPRAPALNRAARAHLLEHLATAKNVISPHFLSLAQFEVCVAQCYQGYELFSRAAGAPLYQPGDGSSEEKLQIVYVDSKHMDRMIDGGKLPESATSGVWIANSGLECGRGQISFQELHDLIDGMHRLAERLCAMESPPRSSDNFADNAP